MWSFRQWVYLWGKRILYDIRSFYKIVFTHKGGFEKLMRRWVKKDLSHEKSRQALRK